MTKPTRVDLVLIGICAAIETTGLYLALRRFFRVETR